MATDFTQDSLLYFLQLHGGKVKNSALLSHFQTFLGDQENKKQNREMFKRFVNSVAVVKQDEGVSYIVLKKAYLRLSGDFNAPKTHRKAEQPVRVKERCFRADGNQNQEDTFLGSTASRAQSKSQRELHVPQSSTNQINTALSLPVAGILNNNNVDAVNFEKPIRNSSPDASGHALTHNTGELFPYNTKPKVSRQDEKHFIAEPVQRASKLPELCNKPKYTEATLGQPKEPIAQRELFCSPPKVLLHAVELEEPRFQQVVQHAVSGQVHSNEAKDRGRSKATAAPWPLHPMLEHASRTSTSSPCISDRPAVKYPHAQPDSALTSSNGSIASSRPQESGYASGVSSQLPLSSLPLEEDDDHGPPAPGYVDLHHIHRKALPGLSSSHSSLVPSSAGSPDWPQGSSVGEWTSDEELDTGGAFGEQGFKVHSMLQRAEQAKRLSLVLRAERNDIAWHRSTGDLDTQNLSAMSLWNHSTSHLDNQESSSSWHRSMGNLHDDQAEPEAGPPGMTPEAVLRPSVRRLKSKLRSRMCRSLGADLDQAFMEDSISARHNRLQVLSTSLSFRYPFSASTTPPRGNSQRDLAASPSPSGKSVSSTGHHHDSSYFHRQPLVPLESNEHDWLVRGAAGVWTDIYALFREDPGLLTKRDFITGYTVLHWVAKHGDHRVLNTLWYGVNKMGMTLDIDSKTTCGYTPLHLAAIHGHKMMIRVLVHKFKAKVSLRDTNGKKPWQYLGRDTQGDLLQLLGAPPRAGGATGARITNPTAPVSSADRLASTSGPVKRTTSIAAFLKPKALQRNTCLHADSLM